MVRFHAAELSRVDLDDALAVCLVFLRSEPAAWDRAAGRCLGRVCVERSLGLRDAILAGACLDALGRGEQEAPTRFAGCARGSRCAARSLAGPLGKTAIRGGVQGALVGAMQPSVGALVDGGLAIRGLGVAHPEGDEDQDRTACGVACPAQHRAPLAVVIRGCGP